VKVYEVLTQYACGCQVRGETRKGHPRYFAIEYCPKHKAAPAMYEALIAIGDLLFGLPENKLRLKALAKAEGK